MQEASFPVTWISRRRLWRKSSERNFQSKKWLTFMSQRRLSGFFQVFAPTWSKNESRDILKVHTWNSDLFQVGEWVSSDVRAGNPMRRYTCHDLAGSCPWGKNWEEGQRGEDWGPSHSQQPPLGARGGFLIEYMNGWNLEWVQCTRGFLEVLWHLHMELNLQMFIWNLLPILEETSDSGE